MTKDIVSIKESASWIRIKHVLHKLLIGDVGRCDGAEVVPFGSVVGRMRRDEVAILLCISDVVGEPGGVGAWCTFDIGVSKVTGVVDSVEEGGVPDSELFGEGNEGMKVRSAVFVEFFADGVVLDLARGREERNHVLNEVVRVNVSARVS